MAKMMGCVSEILFGLITQQKHDVKESSLVDYEV